MVSEHRVNHAIDRAPAGLLKCICNSNSQLPTNRVVVISVFTHCRNYVNYCISSSRSDHQTKLRAAHLISSEIHSNNEHTENNECYGLNGMAPCMRCSSQFKRTRADFPKQDSSRLDCIACVVDKLKSMKYIRIWQNCNGNIAPHRTGLISDI